MRVSEHEVCGAEIANIEGIQGNLGSGQIVEHYIVAHRNRSLPRQKVKGSRGQSRGASINLVKSRSRKAGG